MRLLYDDVDENIEQITNSIKLPNEFEDFIKTDIRSIVVIYMPVFYLYSYVNNEIQVNTHSVVNSMFTLDAFKSKCFRTLREGKFMLIYHVKYCSDVDEYEVRYVSVDLCPVLYSKYHKCRRYDKITNILDELK
jgi:hypothetical protein